MFLNIALFTQRARFLWCTPRCSPIHFSSLHLRACFSYLHSRYARVCILLRIHTRCRQSSSALQPMALPMRSLRSGGCGNFGAAGQSIPSALSFFKISRRLSLVRVQGLHAMNTSSMLRVTTCNARRQTLDRWCISSAATTWRFGSSSPSCRQVSSRMCRVHYTHVCAQRASVELRSERRRFDGVERAAARTAALQSKDEKKFR
jgi:hypothetical protein